MKGRRRSVVKKKEEKESRRWVGREGVGGKI